MKVTNFRDLKKSPSGTAFATVDVTTGIWPFRKTRTEVIFRAIVYWRYLDSGEYAPQSMISEQELAYEAREEFRTCSSS